MMKGKWAWMLVAAAPLLIGIGTGCAGFWQSPSTSTGGGTSSQSSGFFYVLNQQTKQIAVYSIASGKLTQVSGSPYALSSAPFSIAIAPSGGLLYVGTATGIFLYDIGSGGALTLANSSNVISQDIATTMQVDSTGNWLVEAGPNLPELFAIHINSSTGIPVSTTEQSASLPAATLEQVTISPDNLHIFVALGSSGTENVTFAAGANTPLGAITNIPVLNSGGAALSVAVDPSSRLLYIGETAAVSSANAGGLRVFNYNTLAELTTSPFASGGLSPIAIVPTHHGTNAGDYVYVANRNVSNGVNGDIAAFAVSTTGTNTSLTSLNTTVSVGATPLGLAQDSTGNYLLVVDSGGSPDLAAFTFDTTTAGKLDAALTASTGTDPVQASAIAALP